MAGSPIGVGKVQLRILQVLWEKREATAREITDELSKTEPIAHSTVQTLLRKLEAKGSVRHEVRDRVFVFIPVAQEAEVAVRATRDLLHRVFDNSVVGLMAHLLKHEELDAEELADLRRLLQEYEQ
jgi:BlaI family penicillinase repressor